MYRPDNWDDTNTSIPLPNDYPPNEGWFRVMTKEECRIYELGADAILKALKEQGTYINALLYTSTKMNVAQIPVLLRREDGESGTLVFIPD